MSQLRSFDGASALLGMEHICVHTKDYSKTLKDYCCLAYHSNTIVNHWFLFYVTSPTPPTLSSPVFSPLQVILIPSFGALILAIFEPICYGENFLQIREKTVAIPN